MLCLGFMFCSSSYEILYLPHSRLIASFSLWLGYKGECLLGGQARRQRGRGRLRHGRNVRGCLQRDHAVRSWRETKMVEAWFRGAEDALDAGIATPDPYYRYKMTAAGSLKVAGMRGQQQCTSTCPLEQPCLPPSSSFRRKQRLSCQRRQRHQPRPSLPTA
jgi:hypothetical protein